MVPDVAERPAWARYTLVRRPLGLFQLGGQRLPPCLRFVNILTKICTFSVVGRAR